ncbi:MAG: DUF2079 domain-containing protein [Clostridia bacterium]|nr:DUF2079 domain-containing protein [Clostridia bacterium]
MGKENRLLTALKDTWQWLRSLSLGDWIQAVAGVWALLAAGLLIRRGDEGYGIVSFGQDLSLLVLGEALLLGVLLVLVAVRLFPRLKIPGRVFLLGGLLLAFAAAYHADQGSRYYFYYALLVPMAGLIWYAGGKGALSAPGIRPGRYTSLIVLCVLFLLAAGGMAVVGTLRYLTYNTPNFDFGIFCQMFHNMKETGLPTVTCERDQIASHFAVHISPVFYLLLPFYMLFPSPVTLQIGQAVVIASGVFPLWLIAKKLGLSNKVSLMMAAAYAAYPALSTGTLYDIHENCFLAPLLLWLFCAYEYKKPWLTLLAAALVLTVKEDAAVYVAIFALFVLLDRRDVKRGAALMGVALLWFGVALWLLETYGFGGMVGRYSDYQYGDSGLLGVVKTALVNPGFVLKKILYGTATDQTGKLRYLAQLVLPLAGLLFTGRRFTRYILLLPVVLNLLTNWPYQYDVNFQYSFGVSAFFFYLCLLNAKDRQPVERRRAVTFAAAASMLLYMLLFLPSIESNLKRYEERAETIQRMDAVLATIPEDASVTCSTFLLPHLAQRAVVYEDFYHAGVDTEYLVLDRRPGYSGDVSDIVEKYYDAGYTLIVNETDLVAILKAPGA